MPNILGLSNLDYRSHDNAACVLKDGVLVAAAEEERFTRKKHAYDSLPIEATRFCLKQAGLQLDDLDLVTIGWDIPNLNPENEASIPSPIDNSQLNERLFPKEIWGTHSPIRFEFIPHHLAHASSAYYSSGFDSAAVLVIDGEGEVEATTHWHVNNGTFQKIHSLPQDPHSLGFMFEGVCDYFGWPNDAAGIVMGLASYGMPEAEPFEMLTLSDEGYRMEIPVNLLGEKQNFNYRVEKIREQWLRICEQVFVSRAHVPRDGDPTLDFRKKVAAMAQKTIEVALIHSAQVIRQQTKERNLCLSGGAALNCSANGALERADIFDNIYIYPASNDAGVAVGSALYANQHLLDGGRLHKEQFTNNPYLGPQFDQAEIVAALNEFGLSYVDLEGTRFEKVAELLKDNAIVGWFQGRMEIGPRALGARSILASPCSTHVRDRVNDIKRRERWRPLSPSILEGFEADYFYSAKFSPFMLKAALVKESVKERIPGVIHVDGTCRYQSVRQDTNPTYWKLIDSFRIFTGIPLLLNTSFNDHGEPIVCTPQDAIRTFLNRPLDHLVLGNCLINRT